MLNRATLIGNVGKDPEVRSTPGCVLVASFSLATSDVRKDAQGNRQEQTEWHNIVCFNRTAEIVRDYVRKGSKLYVEGKIQTRSWQDNQLGIKRWTVEILVARLVLLSRNENAQRGAQTTAAPAASPDSYDGVAITDEDVPF